MLRQTLYLDTSVIGDYHDTEWMPETRELWRQARVGQWRLVTSIVVEAELRHAPDPVRQVFAETFDPCFGVKMLHPDPIFPWKKRECVVWPFGLLQ